MSDSISDPIAHSAAERGVQLPDHFECDVDESAGMAELSAEDHEALRREAAAWYAGKKFDRDHAPNGLL